MSITLPFNATQDFYLSVNSKLIKDCGAEDLVSKYNPYHGGTNYYLPKSVALFAGKVIESHIEGVQIMSDVWGDGLFVSIACYDGSVEKLEVTFEAKVEVDATAEVLAKVADYKAKLHAIAAAEDHVGYTTPKVCKGKPALVYKGRKIAPGTEVLVFWIGSQRNKFSGKMETRAGVTLPDGSKVFCDVDHLQPLPTVEEIAAHTKAISDLKNLKG